MNPHLQYAQAIAGIVDGRGIGIIDTHIWSPMVNSLQLLQLSPAYTQDLHHGLVQWFTHFLDWLLNSENGRTEAAEHNNHGTWFDVQAARYALFVGQPNTARDILESAKQRRIALHIEPDGKQPHELSRTKSFTYSIMNLLGLFELASIGECVGVDLWNYQTSDGRGLLSALNYIAPYASLDDTWPHQEIGTADPHHRLPFLLRRGAAAYNDPGYHTWLTKYPADITVHRSQLVIQ